MKWGGGSSCTGVETAWLWSVKHMSESEGQAACSHTTLTSMSLLESPHHSLLCVCIWGDVCPYMRLVYDRGECACEAREGCQVSVSIILYLIPLRQGAWSKAGSQKSGATLLSPTLTQVLQEDTPAFTLVLRIYTASTSW